MKHHSSRCILLMMIFGLSCDSGKPMDEIPPPPPPPIQDGIWPLRVGASWTYLSMHPNQSVPDTQRTEIIREYEAQTQDGLDGYIKRFYFNGSLRDTTYQWANTNTESGYHEVAIMSSSDTIEFEMLRYPYPADVGSTGGGIFVSNQVPEITPVDTLYRELISKNDTLETPAGTFVCHVYKAYKEPPPDVTQGTDLYEYFVPGVGQVGWLITSEDDLTDVKRIGLLLDYSL